jgi:hypothetical protein
MCEVGTRMSSDGNVINNFIKRVNFVLHSQFILLYIIGFKRLFYHRAEEESKGKLSFLKIMIFLLYLSAFVLTFLQFAEGNIPITVQEEWKAKTNVELMENFPLSIYGEFALIIAVIIVLSIFYFLLTQDKPLSQASNSIKTFIFESEKRKRAFFITIVFVLIYIIYQIGVYLLVPETFEEAIISISYKAGKGLLISWVVIQPFLVFTGLLLTFDIIAKDFPRPFKGYNRYSIATFFLTLVIVVGITGIISSTFGINFRENVGESLPYVALSDFPDVFYTPSGISFLLVGVGTFSFIIASLIFVEIYLKYKRGINETQERRMAHFMFIFPFLIIYVFLNAFPFAVSFSMGLQSLNDILDILGLLFVIFFALFRVMAIRDTSEEVQINRESLRNPKNWLNLIPAYCKVLIIFYLAFVSFYAGLEANTIFTLSGATTQFEEIQMQAVIGISFVIILIVFWRYKPADNLVSSNE